jgi:hypothetical protein
MSETNQIQEAILEANKPQVKNHERGEVGVASPALTIKNLWHEEKTKLNENRRLSLKNFAKMLISKKTDHAETAQSWLDNKAGKSRQERSATNLTRAAAERQASRAARRKRSDSNKNKAKATEDAPATIITKR